MALAISSLVGEGAIMLDIQLFFGDKLNRGKFQFVLRFLEEYTITD